MPFDLVVRRFATRNGLLLVHVAALCLVSAIAIPHNIAGLFFSYDGDFMVAIARAQRDSHQSVLELWTHFGESIGSILCTVYAPLFPFFWPLYLIGERVGFNARTVDHPRGDALPPLIR